MTKFNTRASGLLGLAVCAGLIGAAALVPGSSRGQVAGGEEWQINPLRGPVDLGLTDPSLVGAIDVHLHVDPDSTGTGGTVRAVDVFDAAKLAMARGMRGFVFKTHQDTGSASGAYMVRKHVSPTFEIFGRMASNYATGGINVATLEHYTQIKGGWGRIYEMPTRDSITATTRPGSMDRENLARTRPWMLMMPAETPPYVAVSKNGELLPEVKHLLSVMATIRTIDTNGRMVLATGHAMPEEHLIVSTDCGQTTNVYPTDCLVLAARGLRANGVTQREIDLMYKVNPAKLLGLAPPEETPVSTAQPRPTR